MKGGDTSCRYHYEEPRAVKTCEYLKRLLVRMLRFSVLLVLRVLATPFLRWQEWRAKENIGSLLSHPVPSEISDKGLLFRKYALILAAFLSCLTAAVF